MNKMKKGFLTIGALGAALAPLGAVVACGGKVNYGKFYTDKGNAPEIIPAGNEVQSGEKTAFITDGGSIADKSFNEGTLNGVMKWSSTADDKTFKIYEVGNHGANKQDFITKYDGTATGSGLVVAGYLHDSVGKIKEWHKAHSSREVYGIDIADNVTDTFYGITFKTEESGFMTAVNMGYMLNLQFGDDAEIKVGTFGGMKIPTVTAFMNGFNAGIKFFNANKGNLKPLKLVHVDGDSNKDFSNSFEPGKGKAMADNFINLNARAIMAVAGPQTADVVEAIKAKKKQGKIYAIGVDVDQSQSYGGIIIGSAIKGLVAATETILSSTNPSDIIYDISKNTADKKYVGFSQNNNYDNPITDAQKAAAIAAAQTDAQKDPLWT